MTGFRIRLWSVLYRMPHERNQPLLPLKSVLLGKIVTSKLAVSSTTDTSLKNKIFVEVFLPEGMSMMLYESRRSCSLLFLQCALKQLPWENLTDKFYQYLNNFAEAIFFLRVLADRKLSTQRSTERTCLSLPSQSALKKLLWQRLPDKFYQYLEQFT